jgi:hypothetical protein
MEHERISAMPDCYWFNTATYESAKTYLKAAFEHLIAAGRDVRQLSDFAFERFGGMFVPYLSRFLCDVHEGRISIDGLTESSNMTIIGPVITAGEREAMIREAAYLRAERRGFSSCSPEIDWMLAEREVDERLERELALVEQGHHALASVVSAAQQELWCMEDVITLWLDSHDGAPGDTQTGMIPERKVVTGKKTVAGKSARQAGNRERVKKTAGKKQKTAVKTGGKTAGSKASTKKKGTGKKTVAIKSAPAKKPETPVRKTASKKRPTGATKGRRVAGRKKAGPR